MSSTEGTELLSAGWWKTVDLPACGADRDRRHVRVYYGRSSESPESGEISLTIANSIFTWSTEVRLTPVQTLEVAEALMRAARALLENDA